MENLKNNLLETPSAAAWKKIGIRPHHGINLPLSALHSKNSCGIGEFLDLLPLIDWCAELKLDVIQLLPLNQSGLDPSPYMPISSCALHFAYLSLHALPGTQQTLEHMRALNQTDLVCYAEVVRQKQDWLLDYVGSMGEQIANHPDYQAFTQTQAHWLKPYTLFQALSNHFQTADWKRWPPEFQTPLPNPEELYTQHQKEISFHSILQFLCYSQLKEVKAYAHQKNVFLMGDIPILVNKDSADVWDTPEYFDLNLAAGAPPDVYEKEGQYWGFPLFRWDVLRKNDYDFWKRRLAYAENFFDIFRIDHIVGFFRVWGIPLGEKPKKGHFIPKEEAKWEPQGRELLSMILSSTKMLAIGEDLGTVLGFMRETMSALGICGTKIMRWERQWSIRKTPLPKTRRIPFVRPHLRLDARFPYPLPLVDTVPQRSQGLCS